MTSSMLARRAATRVLRSRAVSGALRALACARGHRLVLVYHRVGAPVPPDCEIVSSVPVDVFRGHLQALGEFVKLVTLDEVLTDDGWRSSNLDGRRPAVAVTFDDDLPSHTTDALPVLRELNVPSTFFLSGRSGHGLGPYWFQQLEALLVARGNARTAALLGLASISSASLALACERDANMRRRVVELAADVPAPGILEPHGVAALAAAGMTIGFHTVDHCTLPGMDDAALSDALTRGREQLVAAAGAPLRYFAYPYGKADARSAAAVHRAGFDAAFTGRPEPLRPAADRHRLGRWEPGRLGVDDLLVKLALRLHRPAATATQVSR
jgi:peptidoglycan/xylan/chitin deacetylase (PgdA/CDA1 family)